MMHPFRTPALALLLSTTLAGMTAARLLRIERDYRPSLQSARELNATLDATRSLLRDSRLGSVESRIARADSQAQRFHSIATRPAADAARRTERLAQAESFSGYFVDARRSAENISMSLDADGSSAEDATLGYASLHGRLASAIATQERAIELARPESTPIELATWLAMALLSAATLVRRAARHTADWPVAAEQAPGDRIGAPVPDGAPTARLQDAVERMARKRLAASVAAARVARRNNERQIELARSWNVPMLSIVPAEQPAAEMDVYADDQSDAPAFGRLVLVHA
jgi:hypothetical protein